MAMYLLNNMGGRNHSEIYNSIGTHAIYDCSVGQLGWYDYENINISDHVFIIDSSRNVAAEYKVTMIADEVLVSGKAYDVFVSHLGGVNRVLFGTLISKPNIPYNEFVIKYGIKFGKMFNPETGMLKAPGFNCCKFHC